MNADLHWQETSHDACEICHPRYTPFHLVPGITVTRNSVMSGWGNPANYFNLICGCTLRVADIDGEMVRLVDDDDDEGFWECLHNITAKWFIPD